MVGGVQTLVFVRVAAAHGAKPCRGSSEFSVATPDDVRAFLSNAHAFESALLAV
jgi:hypothetical protein